MAVSFPNISKGTAFTMDVVNMKKYRETTLNREI